MIPEDYRRSCYFKGRRAIFHRWTECASNTPLILTKEGYIGGSSIKPYGIIEMEDGTCMLASPEEIRFADGGGFGDFIFFGDGGNEDDV